MRLLSPEELARLLPAETHAFRGPVPTQIVSSAEYFPSPQTAAQREVEARIRLEIPEDMQKQHRFAPLGAADGPVKSAIFGENVARLYRYDRRAELGGLSRPRASRRLRARSRAPPTPRRRGSPLRCRGAPSGRSAA